MTERTKTVIADDEPLEEELYRAISGVHDYFNNRIRMAFAKDTARAVRPSRPEAEPFAFKDLRPVVSRALEEMDADALRKVISKISAHFRGKPQLLYEAMDAACNVLYMAASLLPGGDEMAAGIFREESGGYKCIYRMNSIDAVLNWLERLAEGCCGYFISRRHNRRQQLVSNVQDYIRKNLEKRLSLPEVAAVFNFSPNYLSQLFTKYSGTGFVEYITGERINAAKKMLARGEGLVYEIAGKLGFENAFYFSKVFKKVEGISPREYLHKAGKL